MWRSNNGAGILEYNAFIMDQSNVLRREDREGFYKLEKINPGEDSSCVSYHGSGVFHSRPRDIDIHFQDNLKNTAVVIMDNRGKKGYLKIIYPR